MPESIVTYVLNLKDDLSKGIEGANVKATALEGTLKSIGSVIGVLGVSMVAFAGFEALKGAHEIWEKMEFSISQVEAGLKSTQGAAGLTFEEIQESATKTAHDVKFAASEILGMQSILLTFPSITKESFQPATDIIADMSTRLGQDLKSSAIQVGKALQDPVKGVTALRRVGVNFNEVQTETIKNLAETNHLAEAQTLILKELNLEFAGSAQAAAAADAGFRYGKSLEEIRLEVGHLVDKMQLELMPVALAFLQWVKNSVDWIKENTGAIKKWTIAIGAAFITFKAFTIVPGILLAIENALVAAATAGISFGAAMTAALGPVGLLSLAVGGLAYLYNSVADAEENAANKRKTQFEQAGIDAKQNMADAIAINEKTMSSDAALAKAKQDQISGLDESLGALESQWEAVHKKMNSDIITVGLQDKMTGLESQMNVLTEKKRVSGEYSLIKPKTLAKPGGGGISKLDSTKSKATGSKSVTINVSIKDLIGTQNINTTNIKEGAGKIKEMVVAALTGAVQDFQIVAGQ